MRRALVLSGGGCKSAFQVGALYYLLKQLNKKYDIYCGVSAGALNASFLGMYPSHNSKEGIEDLCKLWLNIQQKDIIKRHFPFGRLHGLWKDSFYDSSPLKHTIEKNIDLKKLKFSNIDVCIGSVSLNSGEYYVCNKFNNNFIKHLLASCSIPGIFSPIEIDNNLWIDGGLRSITPLQAAIDYGADEIDVILTSPEKNIAKVKKNAIQILIRSVDIILDSIIENDLRKAYIYNELVKDGYACNKKILKINVIRPKNILINDSLKFNSSDISNMIDLGFKEAMEYEKVNKSLL
ncbi:MAG: patatin-like phospholipase family protein [Chitinophagales bacterium]|nr:patatin-like phospholipase family protein [Chitinophagales bacterium]